MPIDFSFIITSLFFLSNLFTRWNKSTSNRFTKQPTPLTAPQTGKKHPVHMVFLAETYVSLAKGAYVFTNKTVNWCFACFFCERQQFLYSEIHILFFRSFLPLTLIKNMPFDRDPSGSPETETNTWPFDEKINFRINSTLQWKLWPFGVIRLANQLLVCQDRSNSRQNIQLKLSTIALA